ncbi:hypothetical protein [Bordetella genomosp. 11]|uniref:hypothetical protein n=1 Tax=Bordetella genomosp. 11 TaxID=1416808 RepID=UPI001595517D|nr:hypothetical protein [Bordetella genomosp. 11]
MPFRTYRSSALLARQFNNGDQTGFQRIQVNFQAGTQFTVDAPRDKEAGAYLPTDTITVSGVASPWLKVEIDKVYKDGNPYTGEYSCNVAVQATESNERPKGSWQCPDFDDKTPGVYTMVVNLVLPDPPNAVLETIQRTFEIASPVTVSLPAEGSVRQEGIVPVQGEGQPLSTLDISDEGSSQTVPQSSLIRDASLCTSGPVTVDANGRWRCNVLASEEGEYTLTAKEYVNGRYLNTATRHYTVEDDDDDDDDPPEPQDPPADGMVPPGGGGGGAGGGIPLSGFAPPGLPALGGTIFLWPPGFGLGGGLEGGIEIPISPSSGIWKSPPLPFPPGGQYTVNVQVHKHGQPFGKPVSRHFYVSVEIAKNAQQLRPVLHGQQAITGRGYPGARVDVTRDGQPVCTVEKVGPSGDWSCGQYPTDTMGEYTITATHTLAGVPPSTSAVHVVVATPAATIAAPAEGSNVGTPTYVVSGTGEPGAVVLLDSTQAPAGVADWLRWAVQVDDQGQWQSPQYVAVAGSYTVTATQVIDGVAQLTPSTRGYTVSVRATTIATPTQGQWVPAGTLTVQGSAAPGSSLTLADCGGGTLPQCTGGTLVNRTIEADDKGNWSSSYLAVRGLHAVSVQAYTAGIAAGAPATVSYAAQGDVAGMSITAPQPGQSISTPTYTIAGTGQPGTLVTVSGVGLATHANIPVGSKGTWSTTYLSQAGSYTATAVQKGPDGGADWNASASVSYSVAGTAVAAALSITDPAENATVGASHTISGTGQPGAVVTLPGPVPAAAAALASSSMSAAGLSANNGCYTTVSSQGAWSCGPYELAPGPYSVTATQWINNLAAGPPVQRDYAVRAAAAPVTITTPTGGEVITDPVYTIGGTGALGASVTVSGLGLPDVGPIAVGQDRTWSAAYLSKSGTYTVSAAQTIGGQAAGTSAPVRYTVQADATPLTIATPWENQEIDQTPYTIGGSGEPGASVTMSDPQGGAPCQVTVSSARQWSCGPYDTKAGTYWVQAAQSMQVDGKTVQVGDPVLRHYSVEPDQATVPPAGVTIGTPTDGQIVQVPYVVSGTGQAGMQVTVKGDNGLPEHADIDVNGDGQWTTTYGTESPLKGAFTITATQTLGGQMQGTPAQRSYQVQPEAVAIDNPQSGMTVDVPYVVSGRAQPGTTVTVTGNNGLPTYAGIAVNDQGLWTQTYGKGTPSKGQFTITATQYAGSTALGSSDPVTYNVGGTASVSIVSPQEGQSVYLPYTIRGTGGGQLDSVKVDVSGVAERSAPVNADGTWSLTYTDQEDKQGAGPRTVQATEYMGKDQIGQTPTRDFTVVAGPPPDAAIVYPRDGDQVRTNGGRLYKVMGTGASGGQVTVTQAGGEGGPVTVDVDLNGNWMTDAVFRAPPPISDAQHCTYNWSSCKSDPGTVTATQTYGGKQVNQQQITIYGVVTFN